jgi:hypothetical protein
MKMQANSEVMRGDAEGLTLAWEETRCWAGRLFTRERVASAGIAAGGFAVFLGLVGLIEYSLYQALQNWTISGVGPSAFGFF